MRLLMSYIAINLECPNILLRLTVHTFVMQSNFFRLENASARKTLTFS